DRARRTRRRQLHEAQILVDPLIVIGVEADLVDIKRLGPVDGRYRHRHQFNLPVHEFDCLLSVLSKKDPVHSRTAGPLPGLSQESDGGRDDCGLRTALDAPGATLSPVSYVDAACVSDGAGFPVSW